MFTTNQLKTTKLFPLILGIILVLTFTACEDDDEVVPVEDDIAYVSIYHASPNAPDLDISVDNRTINFYPFDYTEYTGYLRFLTGERNLQIGPYDASNIVADTAVTFIDDNFYSVFLTDNYANLDVLVLNDNTEAPADDMAKVRFVHLSPDAPAVNLAIAEENQALTNELNFKQASDFMELSEGEYDFEVRDVSGEEQLNIPDFELQEGLLYTILVRGYATPPTGNDNVLSADVILN